MMEKKPLRRADFITSIILIVFGIWMLVNTLTTFPMKDTYAGVQNVWYVSPALFPLLISSGVILLGAILLINSIKEGGAKTLVEGLARLKPGISADMLRFLAIVLILVTFVYLNIPRIDFFLSAMLCLTVFITMYYLDYGDLLTRLTRFYAIGSLVFVILFWVRVDSRLNTFITDVFVDRLVLTFQDDAFASGEADRVKNAETDLYLNFNDPTLQYSDNRFKEADTNDGTIDASTPITITLSGDMFTGTDGEDFVAAGKVNINIEKVAPGLTPVMSRKSPTELEVTLTGQAEKHLNAHDVDDLTFTFQDAAVTSGKIRKFANSQKQDLQINFKDPALEYSTKAFKEAQANDGSIDATPLIVTLKGDNWRGEDGEDFVATGKVQTNIGRMAPGLTMAAIRTSSSEVQITVSGVAKEHADANDVKELLIRFKDNAFTMAKANRVEYAHKTDLLIDFNDSKLSYSKDGFQEVTANDGTIDNSEPLTITVSGDMLTGADGEDFVAAGKVETNIAEVAPGLTAVVIRVSATEAHVMLTGSASHHTNADDLAILAIIFKDAAFASGNAGNIIDAARTDLSLDFIDMALTYSTKTFQEASTNDGTIENGKPVMITLTGDTWNGEDGEDFVTTGKVVTNIEEVAPGLSAVVSRVSATEVQVALSGKVTYHASINNVNDLTLTFLDEAFVSGNAGNIAHAVTSDIRITFDNPRLIYLKKRFTEADINDGSIDNSDPMHIQLTGDLFSGEDGEDFVATGKVTTNIVDVAPGLTAVITRISPTELEATLTGNAEKHQKAHELENLTFIFLDDAFASSEAASVTYSTAEDLRISFSNPVLSYSEMTFQEAGNSGTVENDPPVAITLTGDTFTGEDGEDFVATGKVVTNIGNVAPGLTAVMTHISNTELHVTLTGKANRHANADDVKTLELFFQDTAFTLGDADIVVNAAKDNVKIDFADLALTYSKKGFREADANDGTLDMSKPLKITLTGDTLTGEDGEDFVETGKVNTNLADIAPGLQAVITRTGPKELEVMLTGAATQHTNVSDVFIGGPFRFSMDFLLFIFFLGYLWYCRSQVRMLGTEEANRRLFMALVVSIAVPIFVIPLFKYALLVPFPVEGGFIELMNLFWYSPVIKAIRRITGRYLLLLGIDLVVVAIIVAIYFKFMRKAKVV